MVFSKIPARAYLTPHLFLYDRLLERRKVIVVTYINELVYDRILSFCGGERGVPDDYLQVNLFIKGTSKQVYFDKLVLSYKKQVG